ncbi:MAG: right-handed parallel beta-helix repeat-containing protein [Planctomycetales bacterium]|nr:right-handed parallel beta-helix repeat-containing protein [Planctomycetales bacterium]
MLHTHAIVNPKRSPGHTLAMFGLVLGLLFLAPETLTGADDQVKLNEMLLQNHGRLTIPAGTYEFSGPLDVDLTKLGSVVISADGPVTIKMMAAGPAIRLTGSLTGTAHPEQIDEPTWLERMPTIDGIGILGGHDEADGIELVQTMQAVIHHVQIRKVRHAIRLVRRNRNVAISDVHLYHNSGIGLFLDQVDLHQINVANSHISYNTQGGVVVRGGNVRNLHLTGCDIEANMPNDPTPTESANVFLDCRESGSVAEVAITGCTIQHFAHYHPQKQAPGGANIRIAGRPDYQPNMITITGNVMSDTQTHVHLKQTTDVTMTGNTFFTTEPIDILIEDSQRVSVASCVLNPREAHGTGQVIVRNSSNCSLLGLICHNLLAGDAAILLDHSQDVRVGECLISGSRNGVQLTNCDHCTVANCTVTNLAASGQAVAGEPSGNAIDQVTASHVATAPLREGFRGSLHEDWRWRREDKAHWKLTDQGLQVLIEPGNMWGGANDAKNVLLRPIPSAWRSAIDIRTELGHRPQKRWEQANLVWYYSDSTMIKLGLEIENGVTNIVMGREENDRTRTIVIIPYPQERVQLRMVVAKGKLRGFFRRTDEQDWQVAGECELPDESATPPPQVSLQFYQGEAGSDRWATVDWLEMRPAE